MIKGNEKGRCTQHETFFYSRFTTLNLKARLKRESLTPEESRQIESVYTDRASNLKKTITFRRLVSFLVVLVFVFSLVPSTLADANDVVAGQPGEIIITKSAKPIANAMDNREFEITLTAKGIPLVTDNPVDIVLVLDTSGSMAGQRLDDLKAASKGFISQVMGNNANAKIEIVAYAGDKLDSWWNDTAFNDAWRALPNGVAEWGSTKSDLDGAIDNLRASGGTNIEAGFMKAIELLGSARVEAQKIVILMSDGEPTYFYDTKIGPITGKTYHGITEGPGDASNNDTRQKAIDSANSIKTAYSESKIYTVGFGDGDFSVLQDTSYNPQYFPAADIAGLIAAYDTIAKTTHGVIATDAIITDTINEDFTLVDGSITGGGSYNAADRSIVWKIEDISSVSTEVSFKVTANDDLYAAAFTNDSAYLNFKPIAANTFYDNLATDDAGYKRLTYNKPVVPVAPIANDDPNDGVFTVITGEELAGNVHSNDPSNTKHEGTGYDYSDKLFRVKSKPDDNGTLTLKDDGTFTYISTAGFVGEYIFTYDIYTYVPQIDYKTTSSELLGAELFDTASVIINVLPKPTYALTVIYEDQDTGLPLSPAVDPNKDKTYIVGATFNVQQVEIDGYDYVGPKGEDKLTGTMPADNVTVTLLYEKVATPPAPTPTPTIPTIVVTDPTLPLVQPTTAAPLPTINVTQETLPLAQPSTVPTINVEPQEIPQSGERTPLWPIGLALLLMAGGLAYILHHKSVEELD